MDRGVDALHRLRTVVVVGNDEDGFADGAVEREGGVEHQCGVGRTAYILIGIADGDGTDCRRETATDACHDKRGQRGQRQQHGQVVLPPHQAAALQSRTDEKAPEGIGHDDRQQHEVPMAHDLGPQHAPQVLLVGKLAEDGGRGASHGVLEVDGIGQVDGQCQCVDRHKHDAAELVPPMPLLAMPRQQHQHNEGNVGDEYGRGVEHKAARQQFAEAVGGKCRREVAVVLQEIGHTGYAIDDVGHQQVGNDRQ